MKYIDFNILFVILIIYTSSVLNANKLKTTPTPIQEKEKENSCIEYTNDVKNKILEESSDLSKNKTNTTYFLFFSSNKIASKLFKFIFKKIFFNYLYLIKNSQRKI